jgi:hypothetical protein
LHPQYSDRFPLKRGCLRSDQVPFRTVFTAVAVTAAMRLQADRMRRLLHLLTSAATHNMKSNSHARYPHCDSVLKSGLLQSTGSETFRFGRTLHSRMAQGGI